MKPSTQPTPAHVAHVAWDIIRGDLDLQANGRLYGYFTKYAGSNGGLEPPLLRVVELGHWDSAVTISVADWVYHGWQQIELNALVDYLLEFHSEQLPARLVEFLHRSFQGVTFHP